jgi:hypothetical protein
MHNEERDVAASGGRERRTGSVLLGGRRRTRVRNESGSLVCDRTVRDPKWHVEKELSLSERLRFHEYLGDDHRHNKRRSRPAYVHAYTRKEKAFTSVCGKEQTMDEHARLVAEMFYLRVRESGAEASNR